jgi:CRISPR-associated protein Cmr5
MPVRLDSERNRAETAFDDVKEGSGKDFKAEYKSIVVKAPALLKANGLVPTIAFLFSKQHSSSGAAHKLLCSQIARWLSIKGIVILAPESNCGQFVKILVKMTCVEVRRATNETIAYLNWLKRFAEGMIEKDDDA